MNEKKKDPRETYDFNKDVKPQKEHLTKNDVIDRPVNQARRYEIKSAGVPTIPGQTPEDSNKPEELPVDQSETAPPEE